MYGNAPGGGSSVLMLAGWSESGSVYVTPGADWPSGPYEGLSTSPEIVTACGSMLDWMAGAREAVDMMLIIQVPVPGPKPLAAADAALC